MNISELGEYYNHGTAKAWKQTGPFRYELPVASDYPVVAVLAQDEIHITSGGASDEVPPDSTWGVVTRTAVGVHVSNCISRSRSVGYGSGCEPYTIDIKNGDYRIMGPYGSLTVPTYDTQDCDLWEWVYVDWMFGTIEDPNLAEVFFEQYVPNTMHFGSDLKQQLKDRAQERKHFNDLERRRVLGARVICRYRMALQEFDGSANK